MKSTIGFKLSNVETSKQEVVEQCRSEVKPVRSLVDVYFSHSNCKYTYFNDKFDLQIGDYIFVEGKFEGERGEVVSVSKSFKIKISDFKKVIGLANACVEGELLCADGYLLTFDDNNLPYNQALSWYRPPVSEEEVVEVGYDECRFPIEDLSKSGVLPHIMSRAIEYYNKGFVRYLSLDGNKGKAIVMNEKPYEIEFTYEDGEISNMVCDCYCTYPCKHEMAALKKLKDMLIFIDENYPAEYEKSRYMAVVNEVDFLKTVVLGKKKGKVKVEKG